MHPCRLCSSDWKAGEWLLAAGLKKQCSDYQHALDELGEHEQQVRACAWAPFCRKLARECGGWNLTKCKYSKNMELTDDRKAIMEHEVRIIAR